VERVSELTPRFLEKWFIMRMFVPTLAALILSGVSAGTAEEQRKADQQPKECRRAVGEITIDGRGNEEAWKHAQVIDGFRVPWQNRDARTATKARLLWDDDNLYFLAEMEDADLYADVKEDNGMLWTNDVFELFFKPDDKQLGYYELQANPAGAILNMYLPSRGSGAYQRWKVGQKFDRTVKVQLDGTLNDFGDRDRGWTAEGRFGWSGFKHTGGAPKPGDVWRYSLCRYDYSVAFERHELATTSPITNGDFHAYEQFGRLRFVGDSKSDE
jgi:hypothetical protein